MRFGCSGILRVVVGLALVSCFLSLARAAGWSDNFNDGNITDGNPVTWNTNLLGVFPGIYDATSGDLAMSRPGSGNNNQLVAFVDNMSFGDTYIRAQGVIMPGMQPEETGGNLALLARLDTTTVSGYVLYVDDGGDLGLQLSQGGQLTDIVPNVDLGINAATDIIIELNIIGNELFGYAWLPGESKPAEPQIASFDNAFSMGKAGIAYDEDDDNTTGVFRWAMAQDTPFVDALAGDFNTDGKVDAADYVNWRNGLGTTFTPEDYNIWKANFGAGSGLGTGSGLVTASVPEPMGFVPILLAAAGLISVARVRQA